MPVQPRAKPAVARSIVTLSVAVRTRCRSALVADRCFSNTAFALPPTPFARKNCRYMFFTVLRTKPTRERSARVP
jgi:hypothetical protein